MALAATAFSADPSLLEKARSALSARADLYCVIGGACTGKSTVCRALAEATGMALIDMDQRIYGGFSFDPARHPAVSAWFSADNPLAWMLSRSWPDFDALNRATNAEYLDVLADELLTPERSGPQLIDGGFTHPSVLAQVFAPSRIVCLSTTPAESARCWETAEDRAQMRRWIRALPHPDAMWSRFLELDRRMSETMVDESRALDIAVIAREPEMSITTLCDAVKARLGLRHRPTTT